MTVLRMFPISLLSLFIALTATAVYLGLALAVLPTSPSNGVRLLMALVAYFPIILIWTNAVLILSRRWQRHPQVSKYALLGLFGFLVDWVVDVSYSLWAFRIAANNSSSQVWQYTFLIRYCVGLLLTTGSSLLVLVALIGWRDEVVEQDGAPRPTESP